MRCASRGETDLSALHLGEGVGACEVARNGCLNALGPPLAAKLLEASSWHESQVASKVAARAARAQEAEAWRHAARRAAELATDTSDGRGCLAPAPPGAAPALLPPPLLPGFFLESPRRTSRSVYAPALAARGGAQQQDVHAVRTTRRQQPWWVHEMHRTARCAPPRCRTHPFTAAARRSRPVRGLGSRAPAPATARKLSQKAAVRCRCCVRTRRCSSCWSRYACAMRHSEGKPQRRAHKRFLLLRVPGGRSCIAPSAVRPGSGDAACVRGAAPACRSS